MGNTVALSNEKPLSFSEQLMAKLDENEAGLPATLNKQRFVTNALALLNDTEGLQDVSKPVLMSTLMKCAMMDVDAWRGEAFIIPYNSKKGKVLDFQLSYTGCMKIALKHSLRPIKEIGADLVREGDELEVTVDGDNTNFVFKPKLSDNKIIGAICWIRYEDGTTSLERMTFRELENARKASKAPNSPAWSRFPEQMYKKTILKRATKKIQTDLGVEQQRIWNADGAIDTDKKPVVVDNPFADEGNIVDGEAVEVVNDAEQ